MDAADPKTPIRPYGGVSAAERVAGRRQQLLDAALELYGTRGFAATGVRDLCRQAHLTDRYFYESFSNAEQLFTALYDDVAERLLALVVERVGVAPPDPEQQVRAAIDGFVGALAEDRRKARILFAETASAGGEAEAHVRATLRRFADLVAGTAQPHLPDVPLRLIRMGALSLVGAIEAVVIEWQDGYLDASIDEVIEHLVQLFLAAGRSAGLAGLKEADVVPGARMIAS